jgi:hypothetical protein
MQTANQTDEPAPDLLLRERVEALYTVAKSGNWEGIWIALAGEQELAAACSRYAKPSSGWTFLHQAAYFGNESAARVLIGLGAEVDPRDDGQSAPAAKAPPTASEVARGRGHHPLADLLVRAVHGGRGLWRPPTRADLLPSSSAWSEHVERRSWRELRVGYGGSCVVVPAGHPHFVDSFGRVLVGWHGTFDPPSNMNGDSLF